MLTSATSLTRMGVPLHLDGAAPDVLGLLHVAAAADDVLVAGDLDDAAADVLVRCADRADDVVHRDAVTEQLVRIDVDLVLLHEAADARDLGDAGHARARSAGSSPGAIAAPEGRACRSCRRARTRRPSRRRWRPPTGSWLAIANPRLIN